MRGLTVPTTVGHHAERAAPWVVFAVIPWMWVPLGLWGFLLAVLPVYATTLLGRLGHHQRLCELCIAAVPLNGSELAHQWRRPLRALHWAGEHPHRAMLAFGATVLALGWLTDPRLGLSVLFAALGLSLAWAARHARVMPWCPWCHDDDGGGGGRGHVPIGPSSPAVNA